MGYSHYLDLHHGWHAGDELSALYAAVLLLDQLQFCTDELTAAHPRQFTKVTSKVTKVNSQVKKGPSFKKPIQMSKPMLH